MSKVQGNPDITLRDYFAGQAMSKLMIDRSWDASRLEQLAKACYTLADAMIKVRDSEPTKSGT